jgi:hypothetical protein
MRVRIISDCWVNGTSGLGQLDLVLILHGGRRESAAAEAVTAVVGSRENFHDDNWAARVAELYFGAAVWCPKFAAQSPFFRAAQKHTSHFRDRSFAGAGSLFFASRALKSVLRHDFCFISFIGDALNAVSFRSTYVGRFTR